MAITITQATQFASDYRAYPIDKSGKLRFNYFSMPAVTVASDAGSTINLCRLPPGRVRMLPWLNRIWTSAFGASRVFDLGYRAFEKEDGTEEAESANALLNDLDISSAVNGSVMATNTLAKYDFFSRKGVIIFGTVAGGTIPVAATLQGYVAYIHE